MQPDTDPAYTHNVHCTNRSYCAFPHRSGWPHYTEPNDSRGRGISIWIYKWISRLTEEGPGTKLMEFYSNNKNLNDELAREKDDLVNAIGNKS